MWYFHIVTKASGSWTPVPLLELQLASLDLSCLSSIATEPALDWVTSTKIICISEFSSLRSPPSISDWSSMGKIHFLICNWLPAFVSSHGGSTGSPLMSHLIGGYWQHQDCRLSTDHLNAPGCNSGALGVRV